MKNSKLSTGTTSKPASNPKQEIRLELAEETMPQVQKSNCIKQKKLKMSDKITPKDNGANEENANKGTSGTNKQYDQNQGNRGKQLNPNQKTK